MSTISLSDLSTPKKASQLPPAPKLSSKWSAQTSKTQETQRITDTDQDGFLSKRISDAKQSMRQIMNDIDAYSSNLGITPKEITTPKFVSADSYQRSPFGKQLQITDYSPYTSSRLSSPYHIRAENPHISQIRFLDNFSHSGDEGSF